MKKSEKHLGDFQISFSKFENLSQVFKDFNTASFKKLNEHEKSERVNRALFDLIKKTAAPCFLLPAVLEYIDKVNALKAFESYALWHFELWLNQFSGVSTEENLLIRGKVTGKWVARDAYQILFPISMGKIYPGSHYVTAHGSPDLDTTVASFWGWVDAFSARVGQGLNLWNVPGGPPESQTEIQLLFPKLFGSGVFEHLAKTRTTLALSGIDLVTQKGIVRKLPHESMLSIDRQRNQNAVILVDEHGYYLGDWRSFDVESVRQVISLLNICLRWFVTHLQVKLVALFSKEAVTTKDLPAFVSSVFLQKIGDCEPAAEFSEKQKELLDVYLKSVLSVKKGLDSSFEELAKAMKTHALLEFQEFVDLLENMHKLPIFDRAGKLVENRPRLFHLLEQIIKGLEKAIQSVNTFVDRLEVALKIKTEVFDYRLHSVNYRTEVEEIRSKMGNYPYLTVSMEKDEKLMALGVIHASDLHKNVLGTVTLRDFCNRDETRIPSYFEIISVIDHHKTHLQTASAPMVLISDAQSSNVLCAELAFEINDQFSLAGMTRGSIDKQLEKAHKNYSSSSAKRILQRLLQRHLTAENKGEFFVHPMREYVEYLHFLYAILDDTDLLTKVSIRDLECVANILNRLKSIMLQEEVEIVSLSDIPRDGMFIQTASKRILQHPDMYSLYRQIYLAKEEGVENNIKLCAKQQPSSLFIDTKEQNGCARVGQTKLFGRNYATFVKHKEQIKQCWLEASLRFWQGRKEVDLYMHMISTVAGAEDLYKGSDGEYDHLDELWLWIPFTEQSIEHLKSFLNAQRQNPQLINNQLAVEFHGTKAKEYEQIFKESFLPVAKAFTDKKQPSLAVLKYRAGSMNSRKAVITPYLPKE